MRKRMLIYGTTIAVVLGGAIGFVMAHGGATGIIGQRMNGMMDMARSVKSLSDMFGAAVHDPVVLSGAAEMIQTHSGEAMIKLFPEDSLQPPSEAKPEIWDDWEEFARLAVKLRDLGKDLADSANQDSAAQPAIVSPAPIDTNFSSIWDLLDERALLGLASKRDAAPDQIGQRTTADTFGPRRVRRHH